MAVPLPDLIQLVRRFICDFPKANELRGVSESSDTDIGMCAMLALDDYNITPPPIRPVSFEEHPSTHLLILGTICHLLQGKGILQVRNSLSYNDGGIVVNVWDKGPAYMGNAQYFGQMWESKKIALKRSINISNGFGVVQSAEFNIYNYTAFFGGDYVVTSSGATLGGTSTPPLSNEGWDGGFPKDPNAPRPKHRTGVQTFVINDWRVSINDPTKLELMFVHNLMYQNVAMIVNDTTLNTDITDGVEIVRAHENWLILRINQGQQFNGNMQAWIPL